MQSRRLCFEDHGLRDNVGLLTLLRPRQQQTGVHQGAPAPHSRQQGHGSNGAGGFANGGSASGGAANGWPATGSSGAANGTGSSGGKHVTEAGSSRSQQRRPLLLVGNTHILFNPKRGDIKVTCTHKMEAEQSFSDTMLEATPDGWGEASSDAVADTLHQKT